MKEVNELVLNNDLEEVICDIFMTREYTKKETLIILEMLHAFYEETKYPGFLYCLGEEYYFGSYVNDEELGLEYFKKAAEFGYHKAIDLLGAIYTYKALSMLEQAREYYEYLALDQDCVNSKLYLGNNLMASYLIDTDFMRNNSYDQYYEGLGLVAESFQRGNSQANVILNVLDKDKKFVENYLQRINELKNKVS